jgi:hypothetical protein
MQSSIDMPKLLLPSEEFQRHGSCTLREEELKTKNHDGEIGMWKGSTHRASFSGLCMAVLHFCDDFHGYKFISLAIIPLLCGRKWNPYLQLGDTLPVAGDPYTRLCNHYKTNSVAFSPQTNYTDWATASCWRNLVPTFADRGLSLGQRGGSPTVVNLGFLDRSRCFSLKYLLIYPQKGRVDPVSDALLLRKSGSAGNLTRDLWVCIQEVWPADHIGGHAITTRTKTHTHNQFIELEESLNMKVALGKFLWLFLPLPQNRLPVEFVSSGRGSSFPSPVRPIWCRSTTTARQDPLYTAVAPIKLRKI